MIFAAHPQRIGNGSKPLIVEREFEFFTKTHRADHRSKVLSSDAPAHFIEIDVTALDDRSRHIDGTVALVTVKDMISERIRARAVDPLRAVNARVEKGHRH